METCPAFHEYVADIQFKITLFLKKKTTTYYSFKHFKWINDGFIWKSLHFVFFIYILYNVPTLLELGLFIIW